MKEWWVIENGGATTSYGVLCPRCYQTKKEGEMDTQEFNKKMNKAKFSSGKTPPTNQVQP